MSKASILSYILDKMRKEGKNYVEASEEAEKNWVKTVIEKARNMQAFQESCTSDIIITKVSPIPRHKTTLTEEAWNFLV